MTRLSLVNVTETLEKDRCNMAVGRKKRPGKKTERKRESLKKESNRIGEERALPASRSRKGKRLWKKKATPRGLTNRERGRKVGSSSAQSRRR